MSKKYERVYISALGKELKDSGVEDYGGISLTKFLKLNPSLFIVETIDGVSYVRLPNKPEVVKEEHELAQDALPAAPVQQAVGTPATSNQPLKERAFSPYKLLDFAYIPNYKEVLMQLAQMAEPDCWFVLDEPDESFPGYVLDLKLKYEFAQAVKQQLNGTAEKIKLSVASAEVDTGFVTKEGAHIIAHFILNRKRNMQDCQNWRFDHFSVEGQEPSDGADQ